MDTSRRDDSFRSVGSSSLTRTLNLSDISIQTVNVPVHSYSTLRERAQIRRVLFEDTTFPATDKSLQIRHKNFTEPIEWKRPHEISKKPKFTSKIGSKLNVVPGILGDGCLIPAFCCLTLAPRLLQRCIPEDQDFDEKYAGIFRFRFWRYGEWIELVIDDRLPTHGGKILFVKNSDPNEFWAALLEKAYAKLYGSYGAVQGGNVNWTLQDLTGGISDRILFVDQTTLLKKILDLSMARTTLMAATIQEPGFSGRVRLLGNGLVTSRAYSVTGYAEIPVGEHGAKLVKVKNPWGKAEWRGSWCKGSAIWNSVSDDVKTKLGYGKLAANECWIPFSEFSAHFTCLELCHLPPESWVSEPSLKHRRPWKSVTAHRQWRRGFNAGGGLDSPLLSTNSQFYLEVKHQTCTVLSLMQRPRLMGKETHFVSCGCLIFPALVGRTNRLPSSYFSQTRPVIGTGMKADRDNVRFLTLPPGSYVLLPVTSVRGTEGKFYLRIFTDDKLTAVRELDDVDHAAFVHEDEEQLQPPTDPGDRQLDDGTIYTLRKRFLLMCNRYDEIDAYGLKEVLSYRRRNKAKAGLCCDIDDEGGRRSVDVKIQRLFLSQETCKAAIAIVDKDMNGRVNYAEFMALLQRLILWQNIFRRFTIGNGSVMDTYSLRAAFKLAGFTVSNKILEALVLRYAAKDVTNLEGFINAVVKLHVAHRIVSLIDRYRRPETNHQLDEKEGQKYLQELLRTAIYS